MQPAGLYRLGSSVVVLPASPKLGAVKTTFLLCSKTTFSFCCHSHQRRSLVVDCPLPNTNIHRTVFSSTINSMGSRGRLSARFWALIGATFLGFLGIGA